MRAPRIIQSGAFTPEELNTRGRGIICERLLLRRSFAAAVA